VEAAGLTQTAPPPSPVPAGRSASTVMSDRDDMTHEPRSENKTQRAH